MEFKDLDHNYVNCMNCKNRISRFALKAHLQKCLVKIKLCRFCHTKIPLKEEQSHLRLCAAVTDNQRSKSEEKSGNTAVSKHYGICPICNEYVPWLDMNVHVPTCATDAGKCARCHKNVPSEFIKDHILKYCPKLNKKGSKFERNIGNTVQHNVVASSSSSSTASLPDKSEAFSEQHGLCSICKKYILWVDMNKHTFNCAIEAGKCVRCGDDISDADMEKHILLCSQRTKNKGALETLSQNFLELFLTSYEGDVKINVQDKQFEVHRLVLAARSSVFRAMFGVDMAEKNDGVINISEYSPESFKCVLHFIYSGNLNVVTPSNAMELYSISDKYNLKELKEECSRCLASNVSVDTICDIILLASVHNEHDLMTTATNFAVSHANEIVTTKKWLSFLAKHHILANEIFIKMLNKS